MSKAVIGIKIADGSFYPILEEGTPGEKKLQVTTVRDDQTTVQINLYRSETGDMSDADYVDTLLIDNLVPHQKEEPSFNLLVKIDDNNMLSAEIDDPETGEKSDTKVSLVNMGNKSIFDEPDYKVTPNDAPSDEEFSLADSMADIPDLDDTLIAAGTDDFALPDFDNLDAPVEPVTEESVTEEPVIDLPPEIDIPKETEEAPVASDMTEVPAEMPQESFDTGTDDFTLPDFDNLDAPIEPAPEEPVAETPAATEDFSSFDTSSDDIPAASDNLGSFDTPAEDTPAASDDFSFELPDDFSTTTDTSEPVLENTELSEPVPEAILSDDDFSFSTDFADDDNDIDEDEKPFSFDSLPEFDEIPELANSTENVDLAMDDDLDIDFTVPEDNNMGNNSYNDNTEYEYAPSNNMQNALFGDSDLFEETKKQKERKVLVPLIICILCALISLGVLGVILYLTPSIMKIAGGMQSDNTAVVSAITEAETIAAEEEAVIEKPVIRHAEENEIVVLEKTVQPVVPETTTSQKDVPSIMRHLVKWGDTLWDLAGFYYRNPWLYKIISDANNLKNPDLIISGTYLTIPDR
ncbi:MAG: LysM peptidoglycan-binding domain-containing protein [Spirochaetaceae bacterium]|nr:LysM peptidoglycan-binding domain-containing protein [Spirochaetaceae bacterium]